MENSPACAARFGDRFLAFLFDVWLFSAGYYVSLAAAIYVLRREPGGAARLGLAIFWYALFAAYNGWMLSGSGRTLGKRLLGLAVENREGGRPAFWSGFLRAWGYLASSAPFNLGFLWALFNRDGRAWHDFLAGTRVVEARPKGRWAKIGLSAVAFVMAALLAGSWLWVYVVGPRFYQAQEVANARLALESLARMEENYKTAHGAYADTLLALADSTADPQGFLADAAATLDLSAGFEMTADARGYRISAHARDDKATAVVIAGPGP